MRQIAASVTSFALLLLAGCSSGAGSATHNPSYVALDPAQGPAAGVEGGASVPTEALEEDVSAPDRVVGDGTAASCTAAAFIAAVAQGGVITFNCGTSPVTISLDGATGPAKVYNRVGGLETGSETRKVVIDGRGTGGGSVTLSGSGATRILYMNTCDEALIWTTEHCDDQQYPQVTVQNLTFSGGWNGGTADADGGGAIWARGGRLKVVNSRFFQNACTETGSDLGGGAIRAFDQYSGLPVYVVHSTFGGKEGYGNSGANGGALSSIGVSWSIYNSLFSYNRATGTGGNSGGGGSGGAIYNDGNKMTLAIYGSLFEHNTVKAYGSALFFVSNDESGTLSIHGTTFSDNTGGSWEDYQDISLIAGTVDIGGDVVWK